MNASIPLFLITVREEPRNGNPVISTQTKSFNDII